MSKRPLSGVRAFGDDEEDHDLVKDEFITDL
jgi:hypothetical protein